MKRRFDYSQDHTKRKNTLYVEVPMIIGPVWYISHAATIDLR